MLSPSKIALTVVIILVVMFGYRFYSQLRGKGKSERNSKGDVLDLTQCPACKKYVDEANIECLRGDCPFA